MEIIDDDVGAGGEQRLAGVHSIDSDDERETTRGTG